MENLKAMELIDDSFINEDEIENKTKEYSLTDQWNAELFHRLNGDKARFNYSENKWMVWDGKCWQYALNGEEIRLAVSTVKHLLDTAANDVDLRRFREVLDWCKQSFSAQGIAKMLRLAQAINPIHPNELDTYPMLLNVENGMINLESGEFLEHDRNCYLSKIAPVHYDHAAECPTWMQFLDTVMGGNQEMIAYLQKVVGYALTGKTSEQCMFILYGDGSNGKSTFITTLLDILGDYALNTPKETLMEQKREGIRNDLVRLKGIRFVAAAEGKRSNALDEALVKQLTGGDKITARALYQEYEDFEPEFKIFFATNYKPVVTGADHGIWRRLRPIPFTVRIADKDKDSELPAKLLQERAGILNWAIEGCLLWQREGLQSPQVVEDALRQYKSEQDVLSEFIDSNCVTSLGAKVNKTLFHKKYQEYCAVSGADFLSIGKLRKELIHRGFKERNYSDGSYWVDVQLAERGSAEG